ncbi:MAG: hypothetical protein MJ100_08900 [Ruminococcus sp.]|nr:hypothetical protein [Ruminococcus sp.]
METMLKGYIESSDRAKERIVELVALRSALRKKGELTKISELCLDRRIKLLYDENCQIEEIIGHLNSYIRRSTESAET